MKNVLVLPGTTMIAKEIHDSLILTKGVNLFGAGYIMPNKTEIDFNYNDYAYIQALSDGDIIPAVKEILTRFAIDVVFLAHDEWIYRFRDAEVIAGSLVCKHPSETIDIVSFKSQTYSSLKHLDFIPMIYDSIENVDRYPFVIKPDRGQGSKGFMRVDSDVQVQSIMMQGIDLNEMVISEFLPGEEYTIDCFTDMHGGLIFSSCRRRSEIKNGLASTTEIILRPDLIDLATQLNSELRFTGAWFFQTKNDKDGRPKLLEIGCRMAGASGIQRAIGVNLSEVWLHMSNGLAVSITKNSLTPKREVGSPSTLILGQNFEQIYVDYDDCLVLNGVLNLNLINFLKIQKLKGLEIFLISRHRGNLQQEVDMFDLESIFTDIHHILNGSRKSTFFSKSKSILFIDDAYSERIGLDSYPNVNAVDPSIFMDRVHLGS